MKRVLATVVATVVLAFLIILPALGIQTDDAASASEDTTITRYDADFRIASNGDLRVQEILTVDFPNPGKHGIFRFFDTHDSSATRPLRTPHDITVTRDGRPEPFS